MKAAQVINRTGPTGVRVRDVPAPVCTPDHVLIAVEAAGVTFPDLLLTHGRYQETPVIPFTLGGEFAGIVVDAGDGSGFAVGDRVVGSSSHCAFAEFASVHSDRVLPLPADVSFEHGACLPANYLTMLFALTQRGRLRPGERVLVHGASGGIGTASIQLACALGAREVIAVTSTPLPGLDERVTVVDPGDFPAAVLRRTAGAGVDIVIDPVGGDRLTRSLACMAPGASDLILGFAGGAIPQVDVGSLASANIELVGVGWGAHLNNHPDALRTEWDRLVDLMALHPGIRPVIDRVLPLEDARDALRALERRQARGRLVLHPRMRRDAAEERSARPDR